MSDYIEKAIRLTKEFIQSRNEANQALEVAKSSEKNELRKARETDFTKELRETFTSSLESLERIYSSWCLVQANTHGLQFKVESYIKTRKPRKIERGKVEDAFERVVSEGRAAIIAVQKSKSIEDDIEPQKKFCQCLVDLRYIVSNCDALLRESDVQMHQVNLEVASIEESYLATRDAIMEDYDKTETRIRKSVENLNRQIDEEAESVAKCLIGSTMVTDNSDNYKFLIGFAESQKKKSLDKVIIQNIDLLFNNPNLWAGSENVFFDPKEGNGVIIIKAPRYFLDPDDGASKDLRRLIRNIYFSLCTKLPANNLQFGGIETAIEASVGSLGQSIMRHLGEEALFNKKISEKDDVKGHLSSLLDLIHSRSYSGDIVDIFDYNRTYPLNKQSFILNVFNYLPDCLTSSSSMTRDTQSDFVNVLRRGPKKGIFSIVCVDKDANNSLLPEINQSKAYGRSRNESINADIIEIDDYGDMTFNGVPFTDDITVPDFCEEDFFIALKDRENFASILPLTKVIEHTESEIKNNHPLGDFTTEISIPLGMIDGSYYRFPLKVCDNRSFMLLLGATNSGKSSLLHLLILSMCYFYSPDELELYLFDFKAEKESPEFSKYKKANNNLYVPHIQYLALNNRVENVFGMLDLIASMHNERTELFTKYDVASMSGYNNLPDVKNGKLPKMPFALFIIDEYNAMFSQIKDGNDLEKHKLYEKAKGEIERIMTQVRASGIGIIFSGQTISDDFTSNTCNQIASRMILNTGNENIIKKAFPGVGNNPDILPKYQNAIMKKGTVLISTNTGQEDTGILVSTAFVGDDKSKQKQELAKRIREKYKNFMGSVQVIANQGGLYPLNEGLRCRNLVKKQEQAKATSFYIPLGVSSSTLVKTPLKFETNKNTSNYVALANPSKLYMLERISSVMFLHDYKIDVHYFSNYAQKEDFLDGFMTRKSFIKNKIVFHTEHYDICKQLTEVYEVFGRRREIAERKNTKFNPMFLILHDVEWMMKKGNVTGAAKTKRLETDVSKKDFESLNGLGLGAVADAIVKVDPEAVKENREKEVFDTGSVFQKLRELLKNGNQYNIFLMISCDTSDVVNKLVNNDDQMKDYMVYGSFEDLKNKRVMNDSNDYSLYIKPWDIKIRVFDLFDKNADAFWEEMK